MKTPNPLEGVFLQNDKISLLCKLYGERPIFWHMDDAMPLKVECGIFGKYGERKFKIDLVELTRNAASGSMRAENLIEDRFYVELLEYFKGAPVDMLLLKASAAGQLVWTCKSCQAVNVTQLESLDGIVQCAACNAPANSKDLVETIIAKLSRPARP